MVKECGVPTTTNLVILMKNVGSNIKSHLVEIGPPKNRDKGWEKKKKTMKVGTGTHHC